MNRGSVPESDVTAGALGCEYSLCVGQLTPTGQSAEPVVSRMETAVGFTGIPESIQQSVEDLLGGGFLGQHG
jgi:hypothetical protein